MVKPTVAPATFAAIDIGSNGARLLIKRFDANVTREEDRIKKVMFVRIPLRLGKDVFSLGKIGDEREKKMLCMMKGFKQFMKLNDVDEYRACATSAMRDASNGKRILKTIEKHTGIKLEIIKGQEEAKLLCNNLVERTDAGVGNFAYIDVGGGSTEVSLIHDGTLAESHSYDMGTLRMLSGKVAKETEALFEENLSRYAREYGKICIIGSGGNINKLNKLARHGKGSKDLSRVELKRLYNALRVMNVEQRQETFSLKDDRADVIVPAAEIFLKACEYMMCDRIMVPNISLADSIVDGLVKRHCRGGNV